MHMECIPYRKCDGFHKFGRAFLPGCNGDSHIREGRKEMLLIAYHITLGAKWMLHYSGLRGTFLKQQARWMLQHPSIGSKHRSLFASSFFCHCYPEGYLGCDAVCRQFLPHKKRINFFLPFPFSSPISNCHDSEPCFYTTFPLLLPSSSQE